MVLKGGGVHGPAQTGELSQLCRDRAAQAILAQAPARRREGLGKDRDQMGVPAYTGMKGPASDATLLAEG